MKNAITKSIVLAVAVAIAVGSVLIFIKYVVNPPADVSAKATAADVFNPNLKDMVDAFHPDSLSLNDAEVAYNAIVDRISIYKNDELVTDEKTLDNTIVEASEKFSKTFIAWSLDKFNKSSWKTADHSIMLRIIEKMRKVSIEGGSKKALSAETLSSLTEIESVIGDYKKAWGVARQTSFSSYQNVVSVRNEARTYVNKKYLGNCTDLVNALNVIGERQENSCYHQLRTTVERLQYLYYFENRNAYNTESKRIYALIKDFKDTNAFGFSTANHAQTLANLQDSYDRAAENHVWPDEEE